MTDFTNKCDNLLWNVFSTCFLHQCPWLDALGFVRELLPAAEGGHRAGLHARTDSRPGPAVLPLLHPLAAGQDHRGLSQQGAGLTVTPCTQICSVIFGLRLTDKAALSELQFPKGTGAYLCFYRVGQLRCENPSHYETGFLSRSRDLPSNLSLLTLKHCWASDPKAVILWWTKAQTST